jgi:phenylalanyl-tRNA synthetase alpha chain
MPRLPLLPALVAAALAALLGFLLVSSVMSAGPPFPEPINDQSVYDPAGAIRPETETELERIIDIFTRMGFAAVESRQLDSDFHMFEALNFPEDHPARDDYDTFRTEEGLIPPAHTSTMQNRILKSGKKQLEAGGHIACISYGRCFRNEDLDATHEHTFYQVECVFVSEDATLGQMLGTLRGFFETYYGQKLRIKTQPAYFPFVEPGAGVDVSCFLCGGSGCPTDKQTGWIELLGSAVWSQTQLAHYLIHIALA